MTHRMIVFSVFVLFFLAAPSVFGTGAPDRYDGLPFAPPSAAYLLGTDYLGRDLARQILNAGRTTLVICIVATALAFALGLGVTVLSVLVTGIGGVLLTRSMDALIAIPGLIIAFVLVAAMGSSLPVLILVITLVEFCVIFRTLRGPTAQVMAQPFVAMSRIRGEGLIYIVGRDVWLNIRPYAVVELVYRFISSLLFLSALSVLGIGVQPPASDWGTLIKLNAAGLLLGSPAPLLPGVFIVAASLLALWTVGGRSSPTARMIVKE